MYKFYFLLIISGLTLMTGPVFAKNNSNDNQPSSNSSQCFAGKISWINGGVTQDICINDSANLIRLDSVMRNETETLIKLTYLGGDRGFCLWPAGHKHSLILIDIDTQTRYRLLSKESQIASCETENSNLSYNATNENKSVTLLYNALPKTALHLMLIEEDITIPSFNATKFGPFALNALKKW
ncbi:hypothetical protein [Thorsellia anophelis]|uniref:Uncharacterized protein n=1 Tax=Thorsellia anophelis DSM 18579 TaxID=1123402 RepID=A0A1I0AED1_9GAMM|nr:hypothetical protein [Thorsellia anophelis]SES92626.1 hypothetical protein SAMN02583745_00920 [Thorsellia anophelis DSM 18579]